MDNLNQIKDKILKLLALQEGAEKIGSIAEAANAAEKIQNLLLKYNLDLAEIEGRKLEEKMGIEQNSLDLEDLGWNKKEGTWILVLYQALCRYNFCEFITRSTGKKKVYGFHVIGTKENVAIVTYFGEQLINRFKVMMASAWKEYEGDDKRGKWKRGYLMGACLGIAAKLRESYELARDKLEEITLNKDNFQQEFKENKLDALMVITANKIAKYVEEKMPNLGRGRCIHKNNGSDGISKGYEDGYKTNIHKGIQEKKMEGKLLKS